MLLVGEMLKMFLKMCFWLGKCLKVKNQLLTFPQWELFWGGLCASGWGNVKSFFENVLLAGEMLKSAKQTFNISPVGGFFFVKVLLAGEMLKHVLKMCFWLGKC